MLIHCVVLVAYCTSLAIGDHTEPKCYSRFDYDERMLMKLLRIEDQIQKFGDIVNEMKSTHELETLERSRLFNSELEAFKAVNVKEAQKQHSLTAEIQQAVEITLQKQPNLTSKIEEILRNVQGPVVAFTVTDIADGPQSGCLTFSLVVTNEGDSFDISTGEFNCQVSGLYYFTVHFVKKRSSTADTAGCFVKKNGFNVVRAYIDPQDGATGADNGSYGVSNSAYVRLAVNDIVSLGGCTGVDTLEQWSSFSGYLARPDL